MRAENLRLRATLYPASLPTAPIKIPKIPSFTSSREIRQAAPQREEETETPRQFSLFGARCSVEKARVDKVIGNEKLTPVILARGTGISDDFDITKLRYHKIVLMADADVDGAHISTTFLANLLFQIYASAYRARLCHIAETCCSLRCQRAKSTSTLSPTRSATKK